MARASGSKTRGIDKSRPPASQIPAVTHEIVPGKFNDADWNFMLDRDGNEEYIAELVDELIDTTMGVIFKNYLDHQLFPFTINQAKDAIVEIIEWFFLARDDGELHISSDLGWTEDEEPESAETDCWAQGSIPKNFIAAPPVIMTEITEEPEEEAVIEISSRDKEEIPQEPPELPDAVSDTEDLVSVVITKVDSEVTSSRIEDLSNQHEEKSQSTTKSQRSRKKIMMHSNPEAKKLTDDMELVERLAIIQKMPTSCSSSTKTMLSHPAGTKDALYDEMGNVIAVPKLDPEKLPTHKVNVKYIVVDPTQETSLIKVDLKKKFALGNKQKYKHGSVDNDTLSKAFPSAAASSVIQEGGSRNSIKMPRHSIAGKSNPAAVNASLDANFPTYDGDYSRRQSMIEEINVSQGITIREGGRVKKGPGRYYRKLDILDSTNKGMKPVSLSITNPGITVADLLDRQTPILRPYGDSSPLPPIVPHPPHQAKRVS